MLPAMGLQLGVIIKAVQQLCMGIDIADEGLHKDLLLGVSFVGEAAYTQAHLTHCHAELE